MRLSETKTIDGIDFTVTKMDGMKGMLMVNTLVRIFGPGFGKGLASMGGAKVAKASSVMDMELDAGIFGEAIVALSQCLPNSEMEAMLRDLLETATYQARQEDLPEGLAAGGMLWPKFKLVMQGRPLTGYKLAAFALEVNFASFFGGSGAGLFGVVRQAFMAQMAKLGAAPAGSSVGPAGAS